MPTTASTAVFNRRFARDFWRLGRLYWTTADARRGFLLLTGCIALECGAVYASVLIARAQRDVFDAVQHRSAAAFFAGMQVFLGFALVFVLVATYRVYVRNILAMRWRQSLTAYFLSRWIHRDAYWLRELHGREMDNPDQRIAEDVNSYVTSAVGLSLSFLAALVTLVSFAGMLWALSGQWPLSIGGLERRVPGLMMWVALGYGIAATWITDRVGRRLVGINFDRLRVEADFRYRLVRFRDHVEEVAVAHGAAVEQQSALGRFRSIMSNWWELIAAQRNLTLLTTALGQANSIVPLLVTAPAYFDGHMTLGSLTQTQIAYGQVSASLAFFVSAYQELAQWRASTQRLVTFADLLDTTRADVERGGIRMEPSTDGVVRLIDLSLATPQGRALLAGANAALQTGDRVEMFGPAGVGKTTLFRAVAGLWPFGTGRIEIPAGTRMLFLAQRPYLPIGTLREAVSYPAAAGTFSDDAIRNALRLLSLPELESRLDDIEQWDQRLSVDEHQRLTIARVILQEPDWIIMDDATEALDADAERRVYEIIAERLPSAGVLSIMNRPGVSTYSQRRWQIRVGDDGLPALETQ